MESIGRERTMDGPERVLMNKSIMVGVGGRGEAGREGESGTELEMIGIWRGWGGVMSSDLAGGGVEEIDCSGGAGEGVMEWRGSQTSPGGVGSVRGGIRKVSTRWSESN